MVEWRHFDKATFDRDSGRGSNRDHQLVRLRENRWLDWV